MANRKEPTRFATQQLKNPNKHNKNEEINEPGLKSKSE